MYRACCSITIVIHDKQLLVSLGWLLLGEPTHSPSEAASHGIILMALEWKAHEDEAFVSPGDCCIPHAQNATGKWQCLVVTY